MAIEFKYTVDAYSQDEVGHVFDAMQVVVWAVDHTAALARVRELAPRTNYNIVCIEDVKPDPVLQKIVTPSSKPSGNAIQKGV